MPMNEVVADDGRRQLLFGALAASFTGAATAADAVPAAWRATDPAIARASSGVPLVLPQTEFVYEALFDLAPTLQLGASPYGLIRVYKVT